MSLPKHHGTNCMGVHLAGGQTDPFSPSLEYWIKPITLCGFQLPPPGKVAKEAHMTICLCIL